MNSSRLFAVRGCGAFVGVLSFITTALPVYAVSSRDIIEKLRAGSLEDVEAFYTSLFEGTAREKPGWPETVICHLQPAPDSGGPLTVPRRVV